VSYARRESYADTDISHVDMVDSVDLCGAICVYLCHHIAEVGWMSGRLISANWDMDQLLEKRDEIVKKDLLKFALLTA
jgi:hypothetical protein